MKKNRLTGLIMKISKLLPALALIAGIASLNSACFTIYHQPEVPSALDSYRH